MSRRVVIKRRFSRRFGRAALFVSPASALRFWRPGLDHADPTLLRAAEKTVKAGMVVWDIGANVGLFTFAAAALAGTNGRVFAVEPDLWLVSLLERSAAIETRPRASVTVVAAAAWDRLDLASLQMSSQGRSSNFLVPGALRTPGLRSQCGTTIAVTLDWLSEHLPLPDVLKIDVEGLEAAVLRGATKVLHCRPKILCEVYSQNQQEVASILARYHYRFHDAEDALFRGVELPTYNTLAIPDEQCAASLAAVPVPSLRHHSGEDGRP
ncbi:MAG: FkbM family methyltransferase [Acidobacteria bacterium]|nr:FkbM family methyltransferase [Acidobacteriota bacterium]